MNFIELPQVARQAVREKRGFAVRRLTGAANRQCRVCCLVFRTKLAFKVLCDDCLSPYDREVEGLVPATEVRR